MSKSKKIRICIAVVAIIIIITIIVVMSLIGNGNKIIATRRSGGYFDSREELQITYKSDEIYKIEWTLKIDNEDDIYDLEEDLLDGYDIDEDDIEIKQYGDDTVKFTITGESVIEFMYGGWLGAYIEPNIQDDIDEVTDILEDEGWKIKE